MVRGLEVIGIQVLDPVRIGVLVWIDSFLEDVQVPSAAVVVLVAGLGLEISGTSSLKPFPPA